MVLGPVWGVQHSLGLCVESQGFSRSRGVDLPCQSPPALHRAMKTAWRILISIAQFKHHLKPETTSVSLRCRQRLPIRTPPVGTSSHQDRTAPPRHAKSGPNIEVGSRFGYRGDAPRQAVRSNSPSCDNGVRVGRELTRALGRSRVPGLTHTDILVLRLCQVIELARFAAVQPG